jgi:hypothetical protein
MLAVAEYLANHIHEAPMRIVACLGGATPTRTSGSAIYPAIQNWFWRREHSALGRL